MLGAMIGGYIVDSYSAAANLGVTALLATLTVALAVLQPKT
jgi:DHA1 family purine ribonucleoside efflux pump-like MFS transporter